MPATANFFDVYRTYLAAAAGLMRRRMQGFVVGRGKASQRRARTLHSLVAAGVAVTLLVALVPLTAEAQESRPPQAGAAWSWGHNDRGELGDGTTDSRPVPRRCRGSAV